MTADQKALFDKLTKLQQRVATNSLSGMSNRAAYIEAGGKAEGENSMDATASEILSSLKVKAFMDAMKEEAVSKAVMTRQEMLERLSGLARVDMKDLVEFGEHELGEEDGEPVIQTTWKIKDSAKQSPETMASIAELTAGRDGIKVKQHSPMQAMKQLSDLMGWDAAKKTKAISEFSELSDEDLDRKKQELERELERSRED
jgi:phage terminase small subunit